MADAIFITFVLLISIIGLVYKLLTYQYDKWKKLGLPGPKPHLIYGNIPKMVKLKQHFIFDYDDIYYEYKTKYRAVGIFAFRNPEILLLDPALAHKVMVTDFSKFRDNTASRWITNKKADKVAERIPFFQNGNAWKEKRAENVGGVTLSKLNQAYPIWKSTLLKMTKYIEDNIKNGNAVIETKDLSYRFTSNVMSDFLWGIDSGSFTNSEGGKTMLTMLKDMINQVVYATILYYAFSFAPFMKRFFNIRVFPEKTDKFFSQLTKVAIEMRAKDKNTERADFLSYVLQLKEKKQLSHDDVVGHIMTGMLDGYETTGTVLHHCLFYLAKHPEVQEKLRSEINDNLAEDGFINFDTLLNLPYLEQCLQETIRIITPIPVYSRICTTETVLEFDNKRSVNIQPGMVMTIPIYSYHHDEEFFSEPYTFNPERFGNAEHIALTKRGIFMPYGDGPRICLGMRMGQLGVKASLVQILKEYRVKSCSKTMDEKKPDAVDFAMGLSGEMWLEYEASKILK